MTIIKEFKNQVELNFKEICEKELPKIGLELYDINFKTGTGELIIYIFDKKTGSAVIEDCIKVDHLLTPYIEKESWIPEKLTLEVSSPGVYRHLNSLWHFEKAIGENVEFVLNMPFDEVNILEKKDTAVKGLKGNTKFSGIISTVGPNEVVIKMEQAKIRLPFETIKKANIEHK